MSMAVLGTVKVEVTPEIREAIDVLLPIAETSRRLSDCLCEFEDEPIGASACSEYREAWEEAVQRFREQKTEVTT
jgi:hypothetical protein